MTAGESGERAVSPRQPAPARLRAVASPAIPAPATSTAVASARGVGTQAGC